MKQLRFSSEEMKNILLREGSIVGGEVISEIIVTKSGAIVFNIMDSIEDRLLNLILTDVGLPKNVSKPLWFTGKYKTLRDVKNSTESELLRVPNFGKVYLSELKVFLLQNDLKLKEEE